jgi:hypothetical protein
VLSAVIGIAIEDIAGKSCPRSRELDPNPALSGEIPNVGQDKRKVKQREGKKEEEKIVRKMVVLSHRLS